MNKTVKELRQAGYRVRVMHGRMFNPFGVSPKGGSTVVEIMSPEGVTAKGKAECSKEDNYCRKVGVAISLGRALKELEWQRKIEAMKPKDAALQNELYNVAKQEVRDMIRVRNLEILQEMDKQRTFQL